MPQLPGGQTCAFHQGFEFSPHDLRMHSLNPLCLRKSAIGAGDDVFPPDDTGESHDSIRDHLRVFDRHGVVGDHPGNQDLACRQFRLLPHAPFVLMPGIGCLDRIGSRPYPQD